MINTQVIRDTISAVLPDVRKEDVKPGFQNPFNTEKGAVLLETRMFNETPLHPHKCFDTLTKVLHLLLIKGEVLTAFEESNLFFAVTKLFQSQNNKLRRMFYLAIKTLNIGEGEAFIVTSSLTKDMNSGSDVHRANAIRVLSKIVDSSMAMQIERYLKTAIVDKSPFVASAALLCGLRLLTVCPEVVRRWVNEVTESVRSKHTTVQFHALALLYELKRGDRLALHKVVGSLMSTPLKGPFAECLLLRYASDILKTGRGPTLETTIVDYINSRLRHRSETIVLEAARALCRLAAQNCCTQEVDISSAITALQIMLSSQRPVVRFAAVKTLNTLAHTHPQPVSQCNTELETLLSDTNRSIATLALATLLKTGSESGVERLIKQISSIMTDTGDSFRIEIIKAVRQLASTYPGKHRTILAFLATQLREEASFQVKRDLVEAVSSLVIENQNVSRATDSTSQRLFSLRGEIISASGYIQEASKKTEVVTRVDQLCPHSGGQAQETGLLHLCEFIEDCEYPTLCARVLSLLGELAPTTSCPSKYIRFAYNRLILENAAVRAAAIHALTHVGYKCPSIQKDISTLLESCLVDKDDEIRERARLYFKALNKATHEASDTDSVASTTDSSVSLDNIFVVEPPVAPDVLIELTKHWLEGDPGKREPLDISQLPTEEEHRKALQTAAITAASNSTLQASDALIKPSSHIPSTDPTLSAAKSSEVAGTTAHLEKLRARIATVCPSINLGDFTHATAPVHLTEKEAEYPVMVTKHIFLSDYIVLEFQIANTMPNQCLEKIEVTVSNFNAGLWKILGTTSVERLPYGMTGSAYIVLEKQAPPLATFQGVRFSAPCGTFSISMTFRVQEGDDDFGYDDSYALEPLALCLQDYILPKGLRKGQFKAQWLSLGDKTEAVAKLGLNYRSLDAAVSGLIQLLTLAPCEGTDTVEPNETTHDVLLSGRLPGGTPLLCRGMVVLSPEHGCLLKVMCRSQSKEFSDAFLNIFEE